MRECVCVLGSHFIITVPKDPLFRLSLKISLSVGQFLKPDLSFCRFLRAALISSSNTIQFFLGYWESFKTFTFTWTSCCLKLFVRFVNQMFSQQWHPDMFSKMQCHVNKKNSFIKMPYQQMLIENGTLGAAESLYNKIRVFSNKKVHY